MTATSACSGWLALIAAVFAAQPTHAATTSAPAEDQRCIARLVADLDRTWPDNATINIVAFGHSVPAGYAATPVVDKRNAYPRLLEDALLDRHPHAVLNVITSAVGGENSDQGSARFSRDVLDHHPRMVLIDFGLNDRSLSLAKSMSNLEGMISKAREADICPVLLTPTWDMASNPSDPADALATQGEMIRQLGERTHTPVVDSLAAFAAFRGDRGQLMAQSNHPNRKGHELVLQQLLRLFQPHQNVPAHAD